MFIDKTTVKSVSQVTILPQSQGHNIQPFPDDNKKRKHSKQDQDDKYNRAENDGIAIWESSDTVTFAWGSKYSIHVAHVAEDSLNGKPNNACVSYLIS